MNKRTIVVIGGDFIKNQLKRACENIEFMDIIFWDKTKITKDEIDETINFIKNNANAVMLSNITTDEKINQYFTKLKKEIKEVPLIPIGTEIIEENFFNIGLDNAIKIVTYFTYGGIKNFINVLYYISYNFLNLSLSEKQYCKKFIAEPEQVPFDGIFHKDTEKTFKSFKDYAKWYVKKGNIADYKWIGILTHRHNWNNNNTKVENALIKSFEALGVKVITVFSYASTENKSEIKNFSSIIKNYFSIDGNLIIDGLVNLQMVAALGNGENKNIFNNAVKNFKNMNIPIFRPIISNFQDEETWRENLSGVSMEIPWAFTSPEMMGMTEPIIIGCRNKKGINTPIEERIDRFTSRVLKWIELRHVENKQKKVALFIHNAPCSGVEATIGLGAGLDVFETVVNILKELKKNGYDIEDIPESGGMLHKTIMERKAYQDFRWTSVEDIIEAGGAIYEMPLKNSCGYFEFYKELDRNVIKEIEDTWGKPPGEGMVFKEKLIITGIKFKNVTVMVQPKRGCYGAKCTGEVCKILHDPKCPPPHQYIATYKYVEKIMKANAIIHVGTGGSLEYLPGKTNGLSNRCYPDVVLGTSPNIYVYNAGVGTQGTIAKRRNNAVIIDYLPSCIGGDIENSKIINLIGEYIEAETINNNQKELLKEKLLVEIAKIDGAKEILTSERMFIDGLNKLKDYLMQSISNSKVEKLHVLGKVPNLKESVSFINEYIGNNSKNAKAIKNLCENEYIYNVTMMELILKCIVDSNGLDSKYNHIEKNILNNLRHEIIEVYDKLQSIEHEIGNLVLALDGKFVEPGLSGMPWEDFKNILPTGRNFYLMDCEKIPTKESYKIGCQLADKLIEKYIQDEGKLPEKVAMNMISTDISMTKGEQLSQILYLMGITPVWNENGKVVDLKPISLEKLKRPRIDVTVRISGVLRDSYPDAVNLIDKAVIIASSLNESFKSNFVKKNTFQIANALKALNEDCDIKRRSTIRVFGDKPGTYGAGVDLALRASAWKNEKDIGNVFVYFSSHAYGEKLNGCMAQNEFVENIKGADISYDTTISKRYDLLSCGFTASVQGGFNVVKKLLNKKEMRQYYGTSENKDNVRISALSEEIKKTMNETFFNPLWKENIKKNGYIGATEFMRRIQSVFDWQCLSQNIGDKDINQLVNLYINDEKMIKWFNENNKFALEEIERRFLELYERKKWNADKETLDKLRKSYIKIEGDMEELSENSKGEIQGGEIEVLNSDDIESWSDNLKNINKIFI